MAGCHKNFPPRNNLSKAKAVDIPEKFSPLLNLFNVDGTLFVLTKHGSILRLTAAGMVFFVEVDERWFDIDHGATSWWCHLQSFANDFKAATVSIFRVRDCTGATAPVWYHNGNFVIVGTVIP